MKKVILMLGFILAAGMVNVEKAEAQVVVKVRPARPAKAVVRRPATRRGYVWIDGHWNYNKRRNKYVWRNGYWAKARPGFRYTPGRWVVVSGGHRWQPGVWVRI